jgi:hypothetical protein
MITPQERQLLEERMQAVVPGFKMLDRQKLREAVQRAAQDNQHITDPSLYFEHQFATLRLLVKVCRDVEQNGYGVPHIWWFIELQYQLFPHLMADPWNEVKWWTWVENRGKRRVVTLWGSQNSLKSSWMALFCVVQMVVWGPDCYAYVAGPVKAHADDKIMQGITDRLDEITAVVTGKSSDYTHRAILNCLQLKCQHTKEDGFVESFSGVARFKYIAIENPSSIQGKKTKGHEDGRKGIMLVMVDEFIENPYNRLKQGFGNVKSNSNFFAILSCNPDPEKVQHPNLRAFSMPHNTSGLSKEKSFAWRTKWGRCYRFGKQNSPNMILGRTEYPYLLNDGMIDAQEETAEEALIAAQVDAWGFGSGVRNAPLNEAAIRMSAAFDTPIWTTPTDRVAAFDCSFGGSDPAGVCILDAGKVLRRSQDGTGTERAIFSAVDQITFEIDEDFYASQDWLDEMDAVFSYTGGGWPEGERFAEVKPGQFMGGAWNMAKQAGEIAMKYGVLPQNVTFDASQRADCADAMMAVFGRKNIRWWYEGSRSIKDEEALTLTPWYYFPFRYEKSGLNGTKEPVLWSDRVSQTSSMIWFFACEAIKAGFLMNGAPLQAAFDELCARPVEWGRAGQGSGRKDVMSKAKMKKEKMKSPVYGETLAMAMYFGTRFCGYVDLEAPKWLTTEVKQTLAPQMSRIIQGRHPHKANWKPFDRGATMLADNAKPTDHMSALNSLAMRR